MAGVHNLWESRIDTINCLIDFMNFVSQPTERSLCSVPIILARRQNAPS
jgi:hypothetical protein